MKEIGLMQKEKKQEDESDTELYWWQKSTNVCVSACVKKLINSFFFKLSANYLIYSKISTKNVNEMFSLLLWKETPIGDFETLKRKHTLF